MYISSPVTNGPSVAGCPPDPTCPLYVDHLSGYARLEPGFVIVPVHVMGHEADACSVTPPAGTRALHAALVAAGIDSRLEMIRGGFALPGEDACEAQHFHGFLGQENAAVKAHTKRMDDILAHWRRAFPANVKPAAVPGTVRFANAYTLDLATLVTDPGDTLTYRLPHPTSWRGHPPSPWRVPSSPTPRPPPTPARRIHLRRLRRQRRGHGILRHRDGSVK